jgi:divalent metal cation (Fe/Co/Zn/Cd) transporter
MKPLIDMTWLPREIERIEELARLHPQIRNFHPIRTRRVGGQRQIDLHIQVPGDLSVREGHDIAHQLRDEIERELGAVHVIIHVEPWNEQRKRRPN